MWTLFCTKREGPVKHTRFCPKCGSEDILVIKGNAGTYGAGNNIPASVTVFSAVLVNRYLCCKCSYSEE